MRTKRAPHPGIEEVRWSVIVRDEGTCDTAGQRPAEPPLSSPVPPPRWPPAPAVSHEEEGGGLGWLWFVAVAVVLAIGRVVHLLFLKRAGG